jgi:tetratricopeptide (TPR) repeat protein
MSSTGPGPAVPGYGGGLLQSLDLAGATAVEESGAVVPGMLTTAERAMLVEVVRRTWRGDGAIIDGGSFLGGSLVAEGRGMESSPTHERLEPARFPAGRPIHAYELGHHPTPANPAAERRRSYDGVAYERGESFVPLLEANIARFRHLIELHLGDLTETTWDGSPVELAFIDVCKTPALNAHVSRQFYPALIGGGSTLIHQDFFHDRLPWIRVTMGYLADYFQWEGQVASSSLYSSVRAVPVDVAAYDPYTQASLAECLAYHDAVEFPGIDRDTQLMLALSRVYLMLHKGAREPALEELQDVAVQYVDILGATSQADSHKPPPGSAESRIPRYRMDLAIRRVLGGGGTAAGGQRAHVRRSRAAPPSELDRARAALAARRWDEAREILAPLMAAGSAGAARLLLARTELESGHPAAAAGLLDEQLSRRPRHSRARALRARARLAAGDHGKARDDAEEALRGDPGQRDARWVLFDLAVIERLGRPR